MLLRSIIVLAVLLFGCGRLVVSLEPTAKLRELQIACDQSSVPPNVYVPCEAVGIFSDGSRRNETLEAQWISWDTSVLETSQEARNSWFRGITAGAGQITAKIGDVESYFPINVTSAVPVSLSVTPANQSFHSGTKQQFTAICIFSDNSYVDVTNSASWSVQDFSVGEISTSLPDKALFTAVGMGSTSVRAVFGSVQASTQVTVVDKTLVAILVSPDSQTIINGLTAAYTAQGIYSDASTSDLTNAVTWSVTDGAIGSISNSSGQQGRFTAYQAGSTQVRADLGGFYDTADVTVSSPTLTSVTVAPINPIVAAGLTEDLVATGHYSDGSAVDVTENAVWTTSDSSVATVSNVSGHKGRVTANAPGNADITATLSGSSGQTTVSVSAPTLTSISVLPGSTSVAKGITVQYVAIGHFTDGSTSDISSSVTWTAADNGIATVSNVAGSRGLATGVGIGATNIVATLGSVSGQASITVTAPVLVSIDVTPANATVFLLGTVQYTATGNYTDGSQVDLTQSVTWSSSNTGAATISNSAGQKGKATGSGVGSTTITATESGGISGSTLLNGAL